MTINLLKTNNRIRIYSWMIGACLLVFEYFSFASSYTAIYLMTGNSQWAGLLAFAFVAVDFAGSVKARDSHLKQFERNAWAFISAAWVLSAIGDTALTWFVVSDSMSHRANHMLVQGGIISADMWMYWIPVSIAAISWLVQFLLVTQFEKSNQE